MSAGMEVLVEPGHVHLTPVAKQVAHDADEVLAEELRFLDRHHTTWPLLDL
jgi:hypothetical protein